MEQSESQTSSVCSSAMSSDNDKEMELSSKKRKLTFAKRKYSGSAEYCRNYQPDWQRKYDFVMRSCSKSHFYCKVCCKDVAMKHQGALDIERHSEGKPHQQMIYSARFQTWLSFKSITHPLHEQKIAAEVINMVMIAYHKAALCLTDHYWSCAV